ncbi:Chromosome II, complete genome, related [Eimeria tenella]|uniref:Mitochondrial pyruvate carrier n=1 Tax=Eimeria tenella TaxID=5802 RepID=U6KRL8_EIMTE|nr:Chromosome II, complete genome, related [Eimeria tenella]CDJ40772.1 Chromosome II, complete genome, related [Eimeria tenella]|eukprot:XP_013231522.1 Chromosome II, complete genome, related [Eimeria tenella]
MAAAAAAGRSLFFPGIAPALQRRALQLPLPQKAKDFISHPAGPFTIHFWAPTFKWGISIANLIDMLDKDVAGVSPAQQIVNVAMALTGCMQLARVAYREFQGSSSSSSSSSNSSTGSNSIGSSPKDSSSSDKAA